MLVFSVACGFLSNWQFNRRATKLAAIHLIEKNYSSNPVEMAKVLVSGQFNLTQDTWRNVVVSGHYLPEKTLLVRNRPNDGNAGFEELVPFETDTLGVIFVSRGWIPSGDKQDHPDVVNLPTSSETQIRGHVMASELKVDRTAPPGEIASIYIPLAEKLARVHSPFQDAYLRLFSETPSVGKALVEMPAPSTDEGNNLSYAWQWIMFAVMAAWALAWRIRRDRLLELGIEPKKRKTLADKDAEFEDSTTTAK